MTPENEEFKELLKRSGWNQTEAAKQLQLPESSISRYMNDVDKPAKPTLLLFKILIARAYTIPSTAMVMKEGSENDSELWRRRAKTAEGNLENLRNGLRTLLANSSPASSPKPADKKRRREMDADSAAASDVRRG